MRLALAQTNPTIGDLTGNAELIERWCARAHEAGADLVVFPELALTGYPPKDLLWQQGFVEAVGAVAKGRLRDCTRRWPGLTVVVGAPLPLEASSATSGGGGGRGKRLTNSLLVYRSGNLVSYYDKRLLPTYDVFDENRYFTPGRSAVVIEVAGARVGLSICEDLWRGMDAGYAERYLDQPDPVAELCEVPAGSGRMRAELIVNPSASPFVLGKGQRHREILKHHARARGVYVAAVNQVGGNDELIFDGHAAVYGPGGRLIAAGPGFVEDLLVVDLPIGTGREGAAEAVAQREPVDPLLTGAEEERLFRALVLGVRDYCRKTGFASAVLGLSGGIDSAVVAVLAAAALGPAKVTGVGMPSRYSSDGSVRDARTLAERLGIAWMELPIEEAFPAFERTLAGAFSGTKPGVAEENLQSRIRGTLLMALSNKFNHLLLTTGNKSELAVGYCTLYGDMNGGLAVISDVGKIMVYRLARWMNEHFAELGIAGLKGAPIPEESISKAPSAELRPNQTDQDSLPPYHVLDEIIERYVERREDPASIARAMGGAGGMGVEAGTVARVVRLIDLSEYKRKQAAIGLKVTGVAFGSGRRMPIAQGWRPERGMA